ncbi:BnaC08g39930D [Brassica napus]|uniref:(rape) hypothetical protein n=1 Tax=Brassica napus TaxID=3708 RepID=A0A078FNW1_BRANA|nr:unnamed protein product [Brassica napus]CDY16130.1 BnaC08g39930D [Brassica napus]
MVITSSTENATDSKLPSEKLGDSSPELGDSNSSEKLGDSSTVWTDPVESGSPKGEESDQPKEEEGECVFCVFMKGGGCREPFTAWEVCMEEAEKNKEDIFTKCMEVNSALFKCMDAHSDYYKPILAKKDAADQEEISEEEVAATKQAQG